MHFTTIFATTLAFSLGVAAQPQHHAPLTVDQAKTQCGGGHMACCLNESEIKADGITSSLLTRGLLTDVLGSSDQSCAKWELIENLNLLGMMIFMICFHEST